MRQQTVLSSLQKVLLNNLGTSSEVAWMEAPVSEGEVLGVVKQTKTGSAPGWDSFYYKKFVDTIFPYLTDFFNSLWEGSSCHILQLSPDPGKVSNYRPISLINNDLKLLTKMLANRLASVIASYLHKDQVGFILGWQGPGQIHRAIDIISLLCSG